jgi:hypothetical protein
MPAIESTVKFHLDAPHATPEEMKRLEQHYVKSMPGMVNIGNALTVELHEAHSAGQPTTPHTLTAQLVDLKHVA